MIGANVTVLTEEAQRDSAIFGDSWSKHAHLYCWKRAMDASEDASSTFLSLLILSQYGYISILLSAFSTPLGDSHGWKSIKAEAGSHFVISLDHPLRPRPSAQGSASFGRILGAVMNPLEEPGGGEGNPQSCSPLLLVL